MSSDAIVGRWHGSKNIPFLASGKCVIEFREDNTAVLNGDVHALGKNYAIQNEVIGWKNIGCGQYVGSYGGHQVGFEMSHGGKQLQAVVNPYRLGLVNVSVANQDITLVMFRS